MTTPRLAFVLVLVLVLALSVCAAVHAQFTVFDPTSYAELVEQYRQLVRTYDTVRAEYDVLVAMASTARRNSRSKTMLRLIANCLSPPLPVYGRSSISSCSSLTGSAPRLRELWRSIA